MPSSIATAIPLLGRQTPRISRTLDGNTELGRRVVQLSALAGLDLDLWQQLATKAIATRNPDGRFTHREFAIVCTRQNGKSAILESRILAGLYLWGERDIIYSSHEFRAADVIFRRLCGRIEGCPPLRKQIARIYSSSNDKSIHLKNGQAVRFLSRTRSAGRAFSADILLLDEAFAITPQMLSALLPIQAARSVKHNTQLVYASSAGLVGSDVLADIRERGRSEHDEDAFGYMEWSIPAWYELTPEQQARWADKEAYYGDPQNHADSNPAYGLRVSADFLTQTFQSMRNTDLDGFGREFLGIWQRPDGTRPIEPVTWEQLANEKPPAPAPPIMAAIDVPPARNSATIVFAYKDPNSEKIYCEIIDRREGTSWVPARMAELKAKWNPRRIYLKADGPAGQLIQPLNAKGLHLTHLSARDYANACANLLAQITAGTVSHNSQPELTEAITNLGQRLSPQSGLFTWTKTDPLIDISPAVAATQAIHGITGLRETTNQRRRVKIL
ncbi:MAG: hypothetical protein LBR20_02230 [Propionibacteriaceae bacterium]|jgi:phage terminase large subunit-like protein|nr:hypothetical protein [Propionibacteriaceae bacterium]